jgi:hypothetical protein
MAQPNAAAQGDHAPLMQSAAIATKLKHLQRVTAELLQEFHAGCVDLGVARP